MAEGPQKDQDCSIRTSSGTPVIEARVGMSRTPGPVGWVALQQAQALRTAVVQGIAGLTLPAHEDMLGVWLGCQGLNDGQPVMTDRESEPSIRVSSEVRYAFNKANGGIGLEDLTKELDDCLYPKLEGFGEYRSGAAWGNVANFTITSAFVRLLGAEEQFETDVLKALFYYCPQGAVGGTQNPTPVRIEEAVILEKPVKNATGKMTYSMPHLWTWLKRQADNRVKRAEIFKEVFGITLIPDGYTPSQKDEWYKKRNKIAHGIEGVAMTLGEYVRVEVFVAKTIILVGEQCRDKLKLIV